MGERFSYPILRDAKRPVRISDGAVSPEMLTKRFAHRSMGGLKA
jgi:hypothetical protein